MKKYKKMLKSTCPVTVVYAKTKLGMMKDKILQLPQGIKTNE